MAMRQTDYENVARILKGLPSKEDIRRNAVVSACQLFRARPTFDAKRFAKESGCEPCPDPECNSVYDLDGVALMNLHYKLAHNQNKEEVNRNAG